jgi:hypothetical protein
MGLLTLSAGDALLKVRYLGPIREQINNKTVLANRIDRDESTQSVDGKSFTVPVHYKRNNQAGSGRPDNGTLPTVDSQASVVAVVPNKYIYATIEVTGPTMAATRSNLGSFVRAVDDEVKGATRDMKKSFNRQLHSNGVDALGYWTSADDTSGTVIDDNQGNAFVHLGFGDTTCDLLTISSGTATARGTAIVVTLGTEATSPVGWNVTWTGTVTSSADGDYLVPAGTTSTGASAVGYSMMGIDGIINDTNPPLLNSAGLHALPVATYPWWKAQVFGNSGTLRSLTLALMQQPLSQIAVRSDFDESDVKFLLGNVFIRDKYEQLLIADKRHVNTLMLDGGFEGLDYSGKPFVTDTQCKRNTIFYVTPETMKIFRNQDFSWMDLDGKIWHRRENKDSYFATLFHYGDLACLTRNGNGRLSDLSE